MPGAAVPADLAALVARAERAGKGAPPVEMWNPDHCGDIDMVIRADGSWFYNGTPINRPALVRLFSTVLRRDEDGRTYLVTPVEKLGITVEDAPFLAVEMSRNERDGVSVLTFRTNVGDVVEAGPDHPLRFEIAGEGGGFEPYLRVRGRLDAKLTRALAFEIADAIEADDAGAPAIASGGAWFPLPPHALDDAKA
ncbi:DUF1285 domain-containing protein [Aureimonas sp. Leaf454]|uniref:DUF1285 domain-containing protein n=1 Tax=Aureimonas sp. Leaf454 TaxID=1736381 RepID=UPI001FCCD3A8|nr:DUF1285 domain-containing protein [Aureimonas sp. Leaf454]